jgi:hypothetical protein
MCISSGGNYLTRKIHPIMFSYIFLVFLQYLQRSKFLAGVYDPSLGAAWGSLNVECLPDPSLLNVMHLLIHGPQSVSSGSLFSVVATVNNPSSLLGMGPRDNLTWFLASYGSQGKKDPKWDYREHIGENRIAINLSFNQSNRKISYRGVIWFSANT